MEIKKEENQFEFNPADYDYMDKLLPLKGWIWEIIRRSESYRHEYEKIEKAVTSSSGEIDKVINYFKVKVKQMHLNVPLHPIEEPNLNYFLKIKRDICIPKPHAKYSDVYKGLDIEGIVPVKVILYEEYIEDEWKFKEVHNSLFGDVDIYEEHPGVFLVDDLAVSTPEDTIYAGISRKAKIEDIEKYLLPILREYLEAGRPRIRDDKWKYYLICYDLKQQGFSYKEIADIFVEVYPDDENLIDERNIENYYENALKLISGEYKEGQ